MTRGENGPDFGSGAGDIMYKLCWCPEQGSPGEGRGAPLGSCGDVASAQLHSRPPSFRASAPGRLCRERARAQAGDKLSLAAEGHRERRSRWPPGQGRWAAGAGALLRGAGACWPPPGSPPSAAGLGAALALTSAPGLLSFLFFFFKQKAAAAAAALFPGKAGPPAPVRRKAPF